jgi:UDP-N-acetylglucosamine--N-acetylmuramyl-(pentapeptide) pyrophosphoryl-undecaprenol N-acetylglucosamine transferase
MILVTVGTLPFTRLIRKMDEIAAQIEEEVIMQIGKDCYVPENADYFTFRGYVEMQELCKRARLVVCHGGVGSIVTAIEGGAAVVAVPRSKEHGEAVDDHQQEIVRLLAEEGKIIAASDVDELSTFLKLDSDRPAFSRVNGQLTHFLKRYVDSLGP